MGIRLSVGVYKRFLLVLELSIHFAARSLSRDGNLMGSPDQRPEQESR